MEKGGMRFELFGFPVRVDWTFFLIAVILGASGRPLELTAVWVLVVFVSVLLHELGHAFAVRAQGMQASIDLYSMGGLTSWRSSRKLSHLQRIGISLAGPFAGLTAGAIIWLLRPYLPLSSITARVAVADLLWVNIGWGLLNLLPILPLDGGNVMRAIVQSYRGDHEERLPRQVSIAFAVGAAMLALYYGMIWGGFLAAWIGYNNYTALGRSR